MAKHNETHMNGTKIFWGFLGGALAGGLAGSVAMLLLAPQSGEKTRAQIQQKGIELNERMNSTVEDALTNTRHKARQIRVSLNHQSKNLQQRGQDAVDDQKERLSTLVEAGKTAVHDRIG